MDFHQLRLFVAVAEELHFGRAAARVGMAQPPLSQQIRRLEERLGVRLLERTSRRVSLTPGGAHLLGEARDLLARRERIAEETRRAGEEAGVTLRLGFAASSAIGLLPGIVRSLRAASPGISLHLDDRDGVDMAAALRTGDLDAAIVRGPFAAKGVASETVLREPFVAVVPFDHALAKRSEIALADLADEPFVLFPRRTAPDLHDAVVGMCVGAGFSPRVVQEAGGWGSVVGLVAGGAGVTIAPASAATLRPDGACPVAIADPHPHAELVLAYRPDRAGARVDLARAAVTAAPNGRVGAGSEG